MNDDLASSLGAVRKIAIFRALVLGDLLCSVPAIRAVRRRWPDAEITLIGLPWARELVARLDCVDRFEEFPGFPGLPERSVDVTQLPSFFSRMQNERFDLALQMHGSGNIVNQIVACLGARRSAGFHEPGGFVPDEALYTAWPERGHEIERMLRLVDHLGIPRDGLTTDFPVHCRDRAELETRWRQWPDAQPYVCVHAGAQLASRRWMPQRFAAVADALIEHGFKVVLTGTAAERPIVDDVRASMTLPSVDLVGETSLWSLGALVESAALVVSNDTGIMHVAAALGTPSVAVSSGADVSRWAPLDSTRHQVLWRDMTCRPCAWAVCPYGHECAAAIKVDAVVAQALSLLDTPSLRQAVPRVRPILPLWETLLPEFSDVPTTSHSDVARSRKLSLLPDSGASRVLPRGG